MDKTVYQREHKVKKVLIKASCDAHGHGYGAWAMRHGCVRKGRGEYENNKYLNDKNQSIVSSPSETYVAS